MHDSKYIDDIAIRDHYASLNNELVTAKRELIKSNKELQSINSEKSKLISFLAHDLRTPLSSIMYAIEQLTHNRESAGFEKYEHFVCKVSEQCSYMLELIGDLVDYHRGDLSHTDISMPRIDLSDLLTSCIKINSVWAEKRNITIDCKAEPQCHVRANKLKLLQVMNNLIGNAIKYSPHGATVRVTSILQDETVLITISDEGQGIPKDELDNIFNPYFTASNNPNGRDKSSGLGLAIVKENLNTMGASIDIDSELSKGTTITIRFPLDTSG